MSRFVDISDGKGFFFDLDDINAVWIEPRKEYNVDSKTLENTLDIVASTRTGTRVPIPLFSVPVIVGKEKQSFETCLEFIRKNFV